MEWKLKLSSAAFRANVIASPVLRGDKYAGESLTALEHSSRGLFIILTKKNTLANKLNIEMF